MFPFLHNPVSIASPWDKSQSRCSLCVCVCVFPFLLPHLPPFMKAIWWRTNRFYFCTYVLPKIFEQDPSKKVKNTGRRFIPSRLFLSLSHSLECEDISRCFCQYSGKESTLVSPPRLRAIFVNHTALGGQNKSITAKTRAQFALEQNKVGPAKLRTQFQPFSQNN